MYEEDAIFFGSDAGPRYRHRRRWTDPGRATGPIDGKDYGGSDWKGVVFSSRPVTR